MTTPNVTPPIVLVYTYRCCACDAQKTEDYVLALTASLPLPCPPKGWRVMQSAFICDKHEVKVLISSGEGVIQRWDC